MRFSARVVFEIVPALILVAWLASCRSSIEQPPRSIPPVDFRTSGLRVQVLDGADQSPLPGATIVLTSAFRLVPESTSQADIDGIAYFPVLPPGEGYIVLVTMPGYAAVRRNEIWIPVGQTQTLVIVLGESETHRGLYPAATASASGSGRPADALRRGSPSAAY